MKYLSFIVCFTALLGTSAVASQFQSPSGNIICATKANGVFCYIAQKSSAKPVMPRPKDCHLDWGQLFYVNGTGKAGLICHGDYPFSGQAKTLAYGKTIKGNGWRCTSAKTGMTCKNSQGHGFMLSRGKQVIF